MIITRYIYVLTRYIALWVTENSWIILNIIYDYYTIYICFDEVYSLVGNRKLLDYFKHYL